MPLAFLGFVEISRDLNSSFLYPSAPTGNVISVIVPTLRKLYRIPEILEIFGNRPGFEVVIVAAEPEEELLSFAEKSKYENVTWLFASGRGKARHLNLAVNAAKGENLVFLDSDSLPLSKEAPDIIERAFKRFDLFTAPILPEGGKRRLVYYDYVAINEIVKAGIRSGTVLGIMGVFIGVKRWVFEKIGGFRDVLTEDTDFALRASDVAGKIGFVSELIIETRAPKDLREFWKQRKRWVAGAAEVFLFYGKKGALLRALPAIIKLHPLLAFLTISTLFLPLSGMAPLLVFPPLFAFVARKTSSRFAAKYLFLYSPVWLSVSVLSVLGFATKLLRIEDWVIHGENSWICVQEANTRRF